MAKAKKVEKENKEISNSQAKRLKNLNDIVDSINKKEL